MTERISARARGVAGMAIAALILAAAIGATGALDRVESMTIDARLSLRGEAPQGDVAVVAIDGRTFSELNRQWPFPRSLHARVIDSLRRAGARRIAYDVQFTEPTAPAEDNALIEALRRAQPVVLSTTEVDARGRSNVLGGRAGLRAARARDANTSLPADPDGTIRRVPLEIGGLGSFAAVTAESLDHSPSTEAAGDREPLIDFQGPPETIPTVSFSRVLRGDFDAAAVRDRVVVVGASAPSLQDVHTTSAAPGEMMAGPEVQANAISTVLRDFPLRDAPPWLAVVLAALLALPIPLVALRLTVALQAVVAAGLLAAYALVCQLAFQAGSVIPFAAPAAGLALGTAAAILWSYTTERRARRASHALFARFVGETVASELLASADGQVRLGGRRMDATVMFCDLRGFTRFAETVPAEQVIEVLNAYLGEMSDAILDHGGTLVSYLGDGIMAVFGSPIERADHADAAVAAARELVGPRLDRFNATLAASGLDARFELGVGLNSGPVMSGNVGSERRVEYAAVGDTTNVAARLQAKTKQLGGSLLIADSTRSRLSDPGALVAVGEVTLRGREQALRVWTVAEGDAAQPVAAKLAA